MVVLDNKLHSIPEGAKLCNVCNTTFWNLVRAGKIPTVRIGRRRFVTSPVLQAILNGEINLGN